ncbi:MAG: carboxylating nicotinate-nucleotide diphosphorylase [Peptococcaceae bacterium]|nr:carboxylating nicotinate-nucleotide diphosphorylase [Peptococcaceae bacterium]
MWNLSNLGISDLGVSDVIDRALREDIGTGDLSSLILAPEALGEAYIYAKEPGVVCGLPVVRAVFVRLDPDMGFESLYEEGADVERGALVARLQGRLAGILQGERTALNFLQHLSGIASRTAEMVAALSARLGEGISVSVVDTRKTLPGLRGLQKYAVRTGGGRNHRFGLYDAVMLKDNHLAAVGGMAEGIERVRAKVGPMVKIEVECETLADVRRAVELKADVIMLDNMNLEDMREAVSYIAGRALVEASGGIDEDSIADVAETGVDVISLGCLTHSVQAMDFSLVVDPAKPSMRNMFEDNTKGMEGVP